MIFIKFEIFGWILLIKTVGWCIMNARLDVATLNLLETVFSQIQLTTSWQTVALIISITFQAHIQLAQSTYSQDYFFSTFPIINILSTA